MSFKGMGKSIRMMPGAAITTIAAHVLIIPMSFRLAIP
jgi:hypothetical protein